MTPFFKRYKLALFLAFKSIIKGNHWTLALIIAVMAFSFVNLIFTSSIISGVMATLDQQMIDTMFANIVLSPEENEYYIEKVDELLPKLEQLDGVAAVSAHLNSTAFIEYRWKEKLSQADRGKSGTWSVIGIDPNNEINVTSIHEHLVEGQYLDNNDRDQVLLGVEVAGGSRSQTPDFLNLGGVHAGDKVRLTFENGIMREYTVKGIFCAREMQRADHLAFITRKEMASVFNRQVFYDRATQILVRTADGRGEGSIIPAIKGTGFKGEVRGWDEYAGAQHAVIGTFGVIGSVIGAVGLIVATIVMFIIIYINVLNKKRQIGILRAVGIPRDAIVGSYLIQALSFAGAGIVLGFCLINFVVHPVLAAFPIDLPIGPLNLKVEMGRMVISAFALLIASLMAGLVPAVTVMRENITRTIWGV
ncbi:MAG: FtsX-like permease family protein [Dehalococcoidia bacterium]|nr:FtsX-like permease family protein [Dehalococcoidia bacterium]MDD5494038.1 FtsX-like permease family protein [Dehalococcoidia bacterium]